MTDDEIEALAKKHICPHHDRLEAILPNRVPYQQTEQFRRVKALIVDVLPKLRAPVADERAAFLLEEALGYIRSFAIPGKTAEDMTAIAQAGMRRFTAALASAPVAGETNADDANEAFGDFADQYLTDGNGYAPVSTFKACGEAFNKAWPNREAAFAAAKSEYDRLHKSASAAPQASEAVRDAAIDLEAAAMTLAELMHYPWAHMPEQGRAQMRIFAQSVVSAALSAQPGAQRTGGSDAE